VITTPEDNAGVSRRLLVTTGSEWGLSADYAEPAAPNGLAEAFIICAESIFGSDSVARPRDHISTDRASRRPSSGRRRIDVACCRITLWESGRYGVGEKDAAESCSR